VAHVGPVDAMGVPSGPGTVSMLDARTGALLRTATVGVAPDALAVDERTGRAVVACAGGQIRPHAAPTWLPSSLQRWLPFLRAPAPAGQRDVSGTISVLDG
jgi:hypothetical protein